MDFNSMKKPKAEVVFTRKKIPFVEETIQFQGKPCKVWKANFTQGDASFSFFLKATTSNKYKTKDGGKLIGYYMTCTMFDNQGQSNRR